MAEQQGLNIGLSDDETIIALQRAFNDMTDEQINAKFTEITTKITEIETRLTALEAEEWKWTRL